MDLTPIGCGRMEAGSVNRACLLRAASSLASPAQAHGAGVMEGTGNSRQAEAPILVAASARVKI